MVPVGFIYAVSPLLPNTQPFSWGSRSRPAKGGDEEDAQGTCNSWGEFILSLLLFVGVWREHGAWLGSELWFSHSEAKASSFRSFSLSCRSFPLPFHVLV